MVVWREDRCLLGRRLGRPPGSYSCLAGFVEQAETIEDAVRREVAEEAGIVVDDVVYHASQPWPFPSSLMIGCFAHAATDEVRLDDIELADARWFSREEVRNALIAPSETLTVPGPIAIAHHLLRDWSELPG
jgi:NAD+ diphosphatase